MFINIDCDKIMSSTQNWENIMELVVKYSFSYPEKFQIFNQ